MSPGADRPTPATRVLSLGAGFPDWRLPVAAVRGAWGPAGRDAGGGRGQVGVCAPDQDTLTLAWDAASGALAAAGVDPEAVGGLWWGTTRAPFAEGPSHSFLSSSLGLRPEACGALSSGSTHSGADALLAAWDAVAAGTVELALVVTSDALVPGPGTAFETRCGAGAAALLLGAEGGFASLVRRVTRSEPVVDRYRGDGEPATREMYDARLFREEVFVPAMTLIAGLLDAPGGTPWSLPDPDGRLGPVAARQVGSDGTGKAGEVSAELGDTGAAAALLGLDLGAAGPSAVVAYGGGRTTGILVEVDGPAVVSWPGSPALTVSYDDALRSRRVLLPTGEQIEMGVPPGGAAFVRGNPEMLGLLGGRCKDCGTISTPPSLHPHCTACGEPKLEPVALARHGTVHTYVVNHAMPAPFEAPLPLAVLDLDDGARLMVQGVTPDGIEVGAEVDLVLRRYALERGVPVYGFKARARSVGTSPD